MILQQRGLKICIATGLVVSCIGSFITICNAFAPPTTTTTMIGLSAVRITPSSQRCRHHASSTFRRILPSFQTRQSTTAHAAPADDTGATPAVPSGTTADIDIDTPVPPTVPALLAEGLCAVRKPLEWTSQDAVAYVRGMLERDARGRGAKLAKRRGKGKNKVRVGHGGTLDPLAEGVLVLGVGKGTKMLQNYLSGAKTYRASVKLGFETTTLDMAGNITNTTPESSPIIQDITLDSIQHVLPKFTGEIMQTPPIYSAIRKNGKRMYEEARAGKTAEDIGIEPRQVEVKRIRLLPVDDEGKGLPCFGLEVECGGGTYIRSLVRDIGRELGTYATMTSLVRTQQGPFQLDMALEKDDWSVESINEALEKNSAMLKVEEEAVDELSL